MTLYVCAPASEYVCLNIGLPFWYALLYGAQAWVEAIHCVCI